MSTDAGAAVPSPATVSKSAAGHIRLTSHSGGFGALPIRWGSDADRPGSGSVRYATAHSRMVRRKLFRIEACRPVFTPVMQGFLGPAAGRQ